MSKSDHLNLETANEDIQSFGYSQIYTLLNELTKRWTFPVVQLLGLKGPVRFNELKRGISGISATSLAGRLSGFERKGLIDRIVYPETPPRVEYILTKKGWEFYRLLSELAEWAIGWEKRAFSIGAESGKEAVRFRQTKLRQPAHSTNSNITAQ